eukprot:329359-Pelagomonas_calceolata.AAC.2
MSVSIRGHSSALLSSLKSKAQDLHTGLAQHYSGRGGYVCQHQRSQLSFVVLLKSKAQDLHTGLAQHCSRRGGPRPAYRPGAALQQERGVCLSASEVTAHHCYHRKAKLEIWMQGCHHEQSNKCCPACVCERSQLIIAIIEEQSSRFGCRVVTMSKVTKAVL